MTGAGRALRLRFAGGSILGLALAVLVPLLFGGSDYDQLILELIGVYAIAATGLNLAIGMTGQFQMAQVGCMAVSAYGSSILAVDHAMSPWLAMGIGIALAAVFGALVALITVRTRSHYLLLVTFALQVIVVDMIRNLSSLTGGVNGHAAIFILPVGDGQLLAPSVAYSIVLLVLLVIGVIAASWLRRSYLGVGMQGSRQSEPATLATGLAPGGYRLLAIVISAVYGGVAGAAMGPVLTNLVPASFALGTTLLLLVIVVTGGMGSPIGTVVAASALTWATQVAQGRTTAWPLIYGGLVMVILVVAPGGLASMGNGMLRRLRRARPGAAPPPPDPAVAQAPPAPAPVAPALAFSAPAAGAGHGPALEVRDVARRFGGVLALDGVELTVAPGTVHALIGPNGSGKTTLFNVISGFVHHDSGRIAVFGEDVGRERPNRRAGRGIARTFQHPALLDESTVMENVLLGALHDVSTLSRLRLVGSARRTAARAEARGRAALELVGLSDRARDALGELPYGQRRLVDLARALASLPRLVLLDEPTSGVGAASVEIVRRVVGTLRDAGVTVVVVEHDMRFVHELCDRVTVLNAGRVIAEGSPEAVVADPTVVEAYLGT
jgi:branched-chain amino acid transport system permease protein